jgi:two-component system nitrogen regulation response regulator GlnG
MPKLLVVDDEPAILLAFRRAFHPPEVDVLATGSPEEALALVEQDRPDVVVLDVQLPGQTGLDLYRQIRRIDSRVPVVFITGNATTDTAIQAMQLGAYEYLVKPLELAPLRQLIARALELSRLMQVPAVVDEGGQHSEDDRADAIVGRCPAMLEVYKAIGRVAGQDVTALILGESGTGKELVARAIYQHSKRADRPFLAINCAAIPEQLLESELFGHEKGAFTGADRQRIGKFEQCNGGTLFLDEIGDLALVAQSKILRLLQEQKFERLGGSQTIQTDVRLLAATNQNLEALVGEGKFRQDLYYRLNVFTIKLPPLRERGDDLPLLVRHYLRRFGRELGKDVQSISPEALDVLLRYRWPGNVRELQSIVKQALLRATGSVLMPDFLPEQLLNPPASDGGAAAGNGGRGNGDDLRHFIEAQLAGGTEGLYEAALRRLERLLVPLVLQHTGGNQVQAARILGITRGSLRNKIRELGITIARTVEDDGATG